MRIDLRESIGSELGREQRHSNSPPHDRGAMGWHVEGFVLLRFAHQYGSTRLARLHWSGAPTLSVCVECTDWFETRSTAAHPERDMAQPRVAVSLSCTEICVLGMSVVVSLTFAWLLCARRESPLDGQMRFSRSSPQHDGSS